MHTLSTILDRFNFQGRLLVSFAWRVHIRTKTLLSYLTHNGVLNKKVNRTNKI